MAHDVSNAHTQLKLFVEYERFSLSSPASTRPFLSTMEKRWIIFQLLKVLEECDLKKINHGDLKSENVLLTGWNWVMLADFASFKPTLLPDVSQCCTL